MIESNKIYDLLQPRTDRISKNVKNAKAHGPGKTENFREILGKSVQQQEPVHGNGTVNREKPKDKRLMDTCIEMESIFVSRMLKEMRKTVHKNDMLHGGFAEDIFEDMLYDQYALNISKSSNLGMAHMLYKELSAL